jgi:hypothetical protein
MTPIYHITHFRNLALILKDGCLWCDEERHRRQIISEGIAHEHIKQRRARRPVPTCRGGFLSAYVPFYFAPRSPMLYAIHKRKVEGYAEGQTPIIYLVSAVEKVIENNLPFTFTAGHAEMQPNQFFESAEDLTKIDWALMGSTMWNDTDADPKRKWRRQAEFLVHNSFPVALFEGIGVISPTVKSEVERILIAAGCGVDVTIRRDWYFR